ncbi:hypothetical protein CDIK_1413 [Cucumispora dikerogammari]|nr:hypothetical protein CDIK_1413 [Cucumispora dikerogammari]
MESITESTQETEKDLTEDQINAFYKEMSGVENYVVLQYKFMGYYKVCTDRSEDETSFDAIKNELIVTPLLKQDEKSSDPMIIVDSRDTNPMEINLQTLLLGNIIDKIGIGYELTFPVFLNAPPFLRFFLEPPGSKTFQKKISLFSLEDGEVEYNLTLFIIPVGKDPFTGNIFFKHKDEWKRFDDKNNILSIGETDELKILANWSFKTEKSVLLLYSKVH